MEWWGPAHRFERFETEDELTFQTVKLQRKSEAALAILFAIIAFVLLAFAQFIWSALSAFFAGIAAFMWFSTKVRRLVVTQQELKGDSHKVAWSEVFELRYESGGEDSPAGLAARVGLLRSKCVFVDLTREECGEVQRAISAKWPNLQMAPRPEGVWSELKQSFRRSR